jgi:hypothetical protein
MGMWDRDANLIIYCNEWVSTSSPTATHKHFVPGITAVVYLTPFYKETIVYMSHLV